MPQIRSEYSAQGMSAKPNPMLPKCIARVQELFPSASRIADLGCGKLRHLGLFRRAFREVYLVDTVRQLKRPHMLAGRNRLLEEYTSELDLQSRVSLKVLHTAAFARSRLLLDAIFAVAVFDVVTRNVRRILSHIAHCNLASEGLFVIIAPRNDSSILRRCSAKNCYEDGHVFYHHGIQTFYHNFANANEIVRLVEKQGFVLVEDLSRYRQLALIFRREY